MMPQRGIAAPDDIGLGSSLGKAVLEIWALVLMAVGEAGAGLEMRVVEDALVVLFCVSVVEAGGMLTDEDVWVTQGGGGGGQGQVAGSQGGGLLKRAANKSRNQMKEQREIHTQVVARAVVEHLVVVAEHKSLDGAGADGWMGSVQSSVHGLTALTLHAP
jgi:hypothetical protein